MTRKAGVWFRENDTFYLVMPTGGYRRGDPILNNRLAISVAIDPARVSVEEAEELINKLGEFLDKEMELARPLTELEDDAYAPGGPKSGHERPKFLKVFRRVWNEIRAL